MKKKLKGMYKSMVIWFNTIMVSVITALPIAETQLPSIKPFIGSNGFFYISMFVVLGNVLLRFKTNKGLDEK